jgi:hypothetical protein
MTILDPRGRAHLKGKGFDCIVVIDEY